MPDLVEKEELFETENPALRKVVALCGEDLDIKKIQRRDPDIAKVHFEGLPVFVHSRHPGIAAIEDKNWRGDVRQRDREWADLRHASDMDSVSKRSNHASVL
jgi:hypothetical protein